MRGKIMKINILLLVKVGIGSAAAIFLADRFNLMYSASAGIITLLTIQNTKKETISIALKRVIGFIVAIVIAYIIFSSFGYTALAFGGFVFVFVAICNFLGLESGISMNAVLVTHFLIEQRIDIPLIINEALILLFGMSIGVLVNLIMPKNNKTIEQNQKIVENQMKSILSCIADILKDDSDRPKNKGKTEMDFKNLDNLVDKLLAKAYEDADNTLLSETRYQISYLEMRKLQIVILKEIFKSVNTIPIILPQSIEVSDYIKEVSMEFHELNNVEVLLSKLDELHDYFDKESLPKNRVEFENRAILYNTLNDLEHFLRIKHNFIIKY